MTNLTGSHTASGPTYFNLCHLFERLIRRWGAENVQYLEEIPAITSDITVERSVRLSGILEGVLNFRCPFDFLEWLQKKRSDQFAGRYPADQILDEILSLFCLHLFHDFWEPDNFRIGPIKPMPTSPADWPTQPPDSSCALLVETYRVELRLWLQRPDPD